ncbi:ComEC/Rec2 family competence protein [Nonlabens sp.]|uniref:ComEC/Rec2 family competence protein n=1 Tax=Nonlabens sp. TaxID=1888209 RepID=UPI0025CE996F|nr:ComEC/Rec2 family competence protein [Nonlabens sp.]
MRWLDYAFYRILFFLIAGIIFSRGIELPVVTYLYSLGISFLIALFSLLIHKYSFFSKALFAVAVYCFFFFLGGILLQLSNQLSSNHFIDKQVHGEDQVISLELQQRLSSNSFNDRFYAEVFFLGSQEVSGKALVSFKRTDSLDYQVGDRLVVYEQIDVPAFARNPGDFDYRAYLKSIDVYGQIDVDPTRIWNDEKSPDKMDGLLVIRNRILNKLTASGLKERPRAMIEALVLGQRQNVDPELTKSFRDAGVIHILALSGLHVGIILLILRFLTQSILRLKYGRWIQSTVLIVLLWSFALLTGMSPSIMRAVTMFSFVAIGMNLKRKGSVYHSLTLSAFVLLIYDPRLLFQVGFQLSYMAVFSIVLIQPVLAGLWTWHNKVKDFFWSICTVTIAAQIGVAGVSLFYFHQFPGLFILGNLLLLPVLPLIIGAALLLILLLLIGLPTDWLTTALNVLLEFIMKTVANISSWESFIITDIYITWWEMILMYTVLFSLVLFLVPYFKRSKKERFYLKKPNWMLHLSLASAILWMGIRSFETYAYSEEQFLVLHQATGSAVSLSNKEQALLLTDLHVMDTTRAVNSLERLKNIENHRGKKLSIADLQSMVHYKDAQLVVIAENGVYDTSIKSANVLLSHSPKINIERLILDTHPKIIIADGSNYRHLIEAWKITCDQRNIRFLNTYEDGAVAID